MIPQPITWQSVKKVMNLRRLHSLKGSVHYYTKVKNKPLHRHKSLQLFWSSAKFINKIIQGAIELKTSELKN